MTYEHDNRPLCVDLCCGSGGWAAGFLAEGYRVIGVDIEPRREYPGELIVADVRDLKGDRFKGASIIVASPPCEQFSRHAMPWLRRRNPPAPDLSVVNACWRIAAEAGVPIILENVRAAQRWLGRAKWHVGPFYLWGEVPTLMPYVKLRKKESMSSAARLARARVPFELARYIAQALKPAEVAADAVEL